MGNELSTQRRLSSFSVLAPNSIPTFRAAKNSAALQLYDKKNCPDLCMYEKNSAAV